jgi:HSP20 family protein
MNFVAYTPSESVFKFNPQFGRMACGCGDDSFTGRSAAVNMDIVEDPNAFRIIADLPGMEKDKIKIMVEDNLLTVSGERAGHSEGSGDIVWTERQSGNFSRSFRLTDTIDAAKMTADYKNGILEITLPKKEEAKPRTIEVKVG